MKEEKGVKEKKAYDVLKVDIDSKLQGQVLDIPIDLLDEMEDNPNVMGDAEFNRLVKELHTIGFIDPVQVVSLDNGRYRIIGGHQRVLAARVLKFKTVPAVVLDGRFKDEDLQKFINMRLNVLRGRIDKVKFMKMYQELAKKYTDDVMADMMGIVDDKYWQELVGSTLRRLKKLGLSPEELEEAERKMKDARTIDDLGVIISKIFEEHSYSLQSNFIVFTYPKSNKQILYIQADDDVFKHMERELQRCLSLGIDCNDYFRELLNIKKPGGGVDGNGGKKRKVKKKLKGKDNFD